jgi:serine/threonine protein kinase
MSLTPPELWQKLTQERLASPEQCQQWASEILPKASSAEAENGLKLLQLLIAGGHVTKYQAKVIAGQSTGPLGWGPWIVEQPVKQPLWAGWYVVRRGTGAAMWGRTISASELEQIQMARPSLARALQLSVLQHPQLVRIHPPELIDGTLCVFVDPLSSLFTESNTPLETLFSRLSQTTAIGPAESVALVGQLASALAALHRVGLTHGRVLPDRIYVHERRTLLVVDPLCAVSSQTWPPVRTLGSNVPISGLIGDQLDQSQSAQFTAPELLVSRSFPTPASDVYSLGCVWWWLLTGRPPSSPGSLPLAQSRQPLILPILPRDCNLPEPLRLCLQACLGQNPSSRFASAVEFVQALAAVELFRPVPAAGSSNRSSAPGQSAAALSVAKTTLPTVAAGNVRHPQAAAVGGTEKIVAIAANPTISHSRRRRRRGLPWIWASLGVGGALIALLLVLKLSGIFETSTDSAAGIAKNQSGDVRPSPNRRPLDDSTPSKADPRSEHFEIVGFNPQENQGRLWAPPHAPSPLPIDLLPPGGLMFISVRPAQWLQAEGTAGLQSALAEALSPWAKTLQSLSGSPLSEIEQVTLAFYAHDQSGQPPPVCWRFRLKNVVPLAELKTMWSLPAVDNHPGETATGETSTVQSTLLVNDSGLAYFVAEPTTNVGDGVVREFSVGPVSLMSDVQDLAGARGLLLPQLEELWKDSDAEAVASLLISTPFLFTDGRDVLHRLPSRLAAQAREWLGGDVRGFAVQVHWESKWYFEARVVGTNDADAGKVMARQQRLVQALPANIEQWLVQHVPAPYWRALALRYPQMLRTAVEYTRFGVENGTALMNCYLPSEGGANLLLASWVALQDNSISLASVSPTEGAPAEESDPLGVEAFLNRPIRLSFDQEPIEVALRLVGEEANANLPVGTQPMKFVLDGDAFEKGGITRNQQLRDFRLEQKSVRDALTEIAKRGNPVTTVTDLRENSQSLVWVVIPDVENASSMGMISLTTRSAVEAASLALPPEFAPAN